MRVLIVPFPLTSLSAAACGGTEQVAYQLLQSLGAFPQTTIEVAPTYRPNALTRIESASNRIVSTYLKHRPRFDLIHNQGGFFYQRAATVDVPILMTLHLARRLYPTPFVDRLPPNLHLQCVSQTQHAEWHADEQWRSHLAGYITNGVDLQRFSLRSRLGPGAPLVYLGRICPEKAPHVAIAVARQARRRLLLVGAVHPFPSHQSYFRTQIEPHLNQHVIWIPPPSSPEKTAILHSALAVIIPSQIDETSSLAAMEAAACGVPVIATRRGALPEVVAEGETGWLADEADDLAAAVPRLAQIDPRACRARAERLFCAHRMAAEYHALYQRLSEERTGTPGSHDSGFI